MGKFLLLFFVAVSAYAVEFRILGKEGVEIAQGTLELPLPVSAGLASVRFFDSQKLAYEGGEDGIASIGGIKSKMVEISDTEMKAYGWCYSVDGFEPGEMPGNFPIENQDSVIEWYYGYAYFKDGQWIAQCVRS